MEVIFVYEREGLPDVINQLQYKVVDMIDSALNLLQTSKTESLTLPVVPKIKFPNNAKVDYYEGISSDFNIPSKRQLDNISWSSIFPVNKSYSFQRFGSNNNGYDYVKFLQRRLNNKYPFRMIAYNANNISSLINGSLSNTIEVLFDGIVVVESFESNIDKAGDIEYSLSLKQMTNTDILLSWSELAVSVIGNTAVAKTTNKMLQNAGLL